MKSESVSRDNAQYEKTIESIADDIEGLKSEFPQLEGFSVRSNCFPQQLRIDYGFKTHPSRQRGGWTSGVPNPDGDGIWFYIDFHDPDSMAQIHTQPVVETLYYYDKKAMFLILEGAKTKSLGGRLREILLDHGVTKSPRPHD